VRCRDCDRPELGLPPAPLYIVAISVEISRYREPVRARR
jgi:hypothetical protein